MTLAMKMMDERKDAFEQGEARGRAKGRAEGRTDEQIKIVKRMLARGLSLEEISDMIDVGLDEVKKLSEQE